MKGSLGAGMLAVQNVTMRFGARILFEDVTTTFMPGRRYGLTGPNGSGKSTFMKLFTGEQEIQTGIIQKPRKMGVLSQDQFAFDPFRVVDTVIMGNKGLWEALQERDLIYAKPDITDADGMRLGELEGVVADEDGYTAESDAAILLSGLGVPEHLHERQMSELQGGQKVRVLLAQALFGNPEALLLDEPTNHLDAESVAWLEKHLQDYKGTVIAVTHDRYFLDHVAEWILELDRGEGIPWKGNYSSWLEQKQGRLAREEKSDQKRQKTLERELEWIRMSPKGQHAKSKDRIANYERLAGEEGRQKEQELEIYIPSGPRLGDLVAELTGVSKAYGDRVLFENLSFAIPRAGILGVIGPNGAGKSTLLRLLTGQEQPDSGAIRIGETVRMAYVDQLRANLNPDKTVFEAVSGGYEQIELGGKLINARAWLSRFGFSGDSQQKKVSELSGGQQNRLNLALTLKSESNLLFFDEPTNDLDVNTMRALEEAIEAFAGSAVLVSHDRWFLDRLATHILAFEGDSQVQFFDGNYSQYEQYRKDVLGLKPFDPHRIKYRKLTR